MINKIKMNEDLLSLIIMVQDYKRFIHSQSIFNGTINTTDVEAETQKFLNTIDKKRLSRYNLDGSNYSIFKILNYPITKEMLSTNYEDLENFEF